MLRRDESESSPVTGHLRRVTVLLIGGRAHGHTCLAPSGDGTIHGTMVSGHPQTVLDRDGPGLLDLLERAHGTWEIYSRVDHLGLDRRARPAFACTRPLLGHHDGLPELTPIMADSARRAMSLIERARTRARVNTWNELDRIQLWLELERSYAAVVPDRWDDGPNPANDDDGADGAQRT